LKSVKIQLCLVFDSFDFTKKLWIFIVEKNRQNKTILTTLISHKNCGIFIVEKNPVKTQQF